jgi:hypothetical protein
MGIHFQFSPKLKKVKQKRPKHTRTNHIEINELPFPVDFFAQPVIYSLPPLTIFISKINALNGCQIIAKTNPPGDLRRQVCLLTSNLFKIQHPLYIGSIAGVEPVEIYSRSYGLPVIV